MANQLMRLTPAILRSVYAMLDECKPFDKWNLPDADEMVFVVGKDQHHFAWCNDANRKKIVITVHPKFHGRLSTVVETMAHEMVHVHLFRHPTLRRGGEHNAAFWRYADQICKELGFDRSRF